MTGLFGWVGTDGPDGAVAHGMACALQAHDREAWAARTVDSMTIGTLDGVEAARVGEWAAPAWSRDRRHALWLAGEIYSAPGIDVEAPQHAPCQRVREALLARLVAGGAGILRDGDGEFQLAWWDRDTRTLRLIVDRFGGMPLYWSATARGFAFACGVRGVLMAPGVAADPDPEAIRDAVTFGGFRLGTATNVKAVRMAPGGAVVTRTGAGATVSRYWTWSDVEPPAPRTIEEAIDGMHERWTGAVARRLRGAARPGQTLSGGLDSRLILAEAAPRAAGWTAITYGVHGCDDARLARRAAHAAGAEWVFAPLYQGDWLGARTSYVQQTDGLVQLGDLAHLESLPLQIERLDVHLSGYVGDAVAGPTFTHIRTIEEAAVAMPYYETPLGRGWTAALDRLTEATAERGWLSTRFLLFEHKLPQSTNRWSAAWRPWLRVRKPFIDYGFFDYCQACPPRLRGTGRVYERWLRRRYPSLFGRIPNHRTGVPAAAAPWRLPVARAGRMARRLSRGAAATLGVRLRPWSRAYVNDEVEWARPDVRARIESTVLRPGSVAVELWGRAQVQSVLDDYLSRGVVPTQVVGALYVFEAYHRDLAGHLGEARRRAAGVHLTSAGTS
jgi:hypothetical protein